jgi:hypothetical protein
MDPDQDPAGLARRSRELANAARSRDRDSRVLWARLPGGDHLVAAWATNSAAPTVPSRLSLDGRVRWNTTCPYSRGNHSLYSKSAYIEVRGDRVFVAEVDVAGSHLFVVSLPTGRPERAWPLP